MMENHNIRMRRRGTIPGDRMTVGGVEFAVLDVKPNGDLLVVTVENQFVSRFGDTNNYLLSDLQKAVGEWLTDWVEKNGINPEYILRRTLDLKTYDGLHNYGRPDALVAPLTVAEAFQYREFLPNPDNWSWLATGWDTPDHGGALSTLMYVSDGWWCDRTTSRAGVRPALLLSPDLFSTGLDEESVRRKMLSLFTEKELQEELNRRHAEN